jgi:hypothetical protein
MTLNALCYHDALVIFPVIMGMDVSVALGTRHTFFSMDTCIVLRVLFFVAAFALYLLDLDLFLHMFGEISNINMAAGTGILAMH